jgi:hypothetical protein
MTRRRGETTFDSNERDYPHLVELPMPRGGFRGTSADIETFHREHGIEQRLGRARVRQGQWYARFCFADEIIAEAFRDRFGGERLTTLPRSRP